MGTRYLHLRDTFYSANFRLCVAVSFVHRRASSLCFEPWPGCEALLSSETDRMDSANAAKLCVDIRWFNLLANTCITLIHYLIFIRYTISIVLSFTAPLVFVCLQLMHNLGPASFSNETFVGLE